jgi:2-aminoadipate transaminase
MSNREPDERIPPLPVLFSRRCEFARESVISYLMQQAVENPQVISLAAGLVDPSTLPIPEVLQAAGSILESAATGRAALQYGTTPGYVRLRRLLLEHLARLEGVSTKDLGVGLENVLLTTGSQQLLSLVCEVLFDPGDICLVAGPTYFVFAGNLSGVGVRTVTIPIDADGMQTEALDAALAKLDAAGELGRVKLIYVVSYYDNPAGTCLSASRRGELLKIAQKWSREHRILILEDAAYRELRYDGPELASIWSHDASHEWVIYAQTFSKTFSPGVRVGFGVVPGDLIEPLCDRKGNEDFGSSNLAQHLIASVIQQGLYEAHLSQVRTGYRIKRDAMLAAAERYFSELEGVSWHHPHGGLYVWMSLPEGIATSFESKLFQIAVREGVMYVPGQICYCESQGSRPNHQMRLSFGVQTPEGIDLGMQRLAQAVRQVQTSG